MKRKIASVALAACLALPVAGSALPTAVAGEVEAEPTIMRLAAMDYHFMLADGSEFPTELVRGDYKFTFRNTSEKRLHEVVMFKLLHGKTIQELLSMKPKKAEKHIRLKGFSFARPGKKGKPFETTLRRGRYAMLCFVQNSRRAEPHFLKGMLHEFRVVAEDAVEPTE